MAVRSCQAFLVVCTRCRSQALSGQAFTSGPLQVHLILAHFDYQQALVTFRSGTACLLLLSWFAGINVSVIQALGIKGGLLGATRRRCPLALRLLQGPRRRVICFSLLSRAS